MAVACPKRARCLRRSRPQRASMPHQHPSAFSAHPGCRRRYCIGWRRRSLHTAISPERYRSARLNPAKAASQRQHVETAPGIYARAVSGRIALEFFAAPGATRRDQRIHSHSARASLWSRLTRAIRRLDPGRCCERQHFSSPIRWLTTWCLRWADVRRRWCLGAYGRARR